MPEDVPLKVETSPIEGMLHKIETYPLPVVGIVQGDAIAGGNELALHCDLVVASSAARFRSVLRSRVARLANSFSAPLAVSRSLPRAASAASMARVRWLKAATWSSLMWVSSKRPSEWVGRMA